MRMMKRIEIVIDAAHMPELLEALRSEGIAGYTVIRDVEGYGDRGERGSDGLTNAYRNSYVVLAVEQGLYKGVVALVRPMLEVHGGMCLVSDCAWVKHNE